MCGVEAAEYLRKAMGNLEIFCPAVVLICILAVFLPVPFPVTLSLFLLPFLLLMSRHTE
jgi:hypothetical protein